MREEKSPTVEGQALTIDIEMQAKDTNSQVEKQDNDDDFSSYYPKCRPNQGASQEALVTEQSNPDDAKTPLMPIDGFPVDIQNIIIECSEIYGTHRDLWTAAFIAAISTAIGQSKILKTNYENPPLFWIAQVGASGVGKSEPGNFCFKKLNDLDFQEDEKYKEEMRAYHSEMNQWKKSKDNSEQPQKPKKFQRILIDSTPEALSGAMELNKRGITILRDELVGWIADFGRYVKSGEQQNMLSSWSQLPYKSNRVTSADISIPEPCINVFGGIQPGKLPDLAKDGRIVDGFLPRICFAFPDRIEAPNYKHGRLSKEATERYNNHILLLLSDQSHRAIIELSDAAEAIYAAFYNKNAQINNSNSQPDYLNEVNAKLNIIALRIALLFHCSKNASKTDFIGFIQPDTMHQAIELTEYFRITAKKVYDIISPSGNDKKQIIRYLSDLGNSQTDIARVTKVSQQYVSKVLRL